MNRVKTCALLALVAALCGCWPKAKIVWSPDGHMAAVMDTDALFLCDANGALTNVAVGGVKAVAWLGDSRRMVVSRQARCATWDQAAAYLSQDDKKKHAAKAEKLRKEILAYRGKWEDFESELGRIELAVLYLRKFHRDEIVPKLDEAGRKSFEEFKFNLSLLQVCRVDGTTLKLGAVLTSLPEDIIGIRPSLDGQFVAYVRAVEHKDQATSKGLALYVVSTRAPTTARLVAEWVSMYPDFSPDGRYIVYAASNAPKEFMENSPMMLGTISRARLRGDDGKILAEFPQEDLAEVVFHDALRVRCMKDGRILFASTEAHLPAASKDTSERLSLFALDPSRQPTVTRILPRQAERIAGNRVDLFELCPDQARVSIPSENGKVTVLQLATGDVSVAQEAEDPEGKLRTIPTWRSAAELCFAVPAGSPHGSAARAEIVLWSAKATKCISGNWPALDMLEAQPAQAKTRPAQNTR